MSINLSIYNLRKWHCLCFVCLFCYINCLCPHNGRDKSHNGSIYGMSDSDFAGSIDNRKSQTGWIFIFNGSAISWHSVQQNCVALSTPEAEYMAASDTAKEGQSLLKLADNIFNKQVNLSLLE